MPTLDNKNILHKTYVNDSIYLVAKEHKEIVKLYFAYLGLLGLLLTSHKPMKKPLKKYYVRFNPIVTEKPKGDVPLLCYRSYFKFSCSCIFLLFLNGTDHQLCI